MYQSLYSCFVSLKTHKFTTPWEQIVSCAHWSPHWLINMWPWYAIWILLLSRATPGILTDLHIALTKREKNSFITWRARISIPETQRCQLSMMQWCHFCYFLQHRLSYLHVLSAVFHLVHTFMISSSVVFLRKLLLLYWKNSPMWRSISIKQRTPKCLTETLHLKKHLYHHPDIIQTNPQPDKTLSFK